ncbi:MAG: carboxypeptidase regulatory-like domain-containing protein, partial [Acidobacteria bacterium]|nr:carboxypeptidase regulatory-like domain-containing protein [Acidobacteriota bacterium]
MIRRHCSLRILFALLGALCVLTMGASSTSAQPVRFLGREEIILYGIGLRVEPATQTVPKDFATIVSTFLQAPTLPGDVSPFAPDAEMRATLRGPSFAQPIELTARPNSPFNIPVLTVPGTHVLENIRMVSGGEVVMYATPESARIDVIERLLVTTVTARPLTADEIREKGIVFDKDNFQAYNFTAAFAVDDGSKIDISFPVVLPTVLPPANVDVSTVDLQGVTGPLLKGLKTIIPDTLEIQSRIPNLSVVGFTLRLDDQPAGQSFVVPPIPGVIVIPGDIGFLNQFFSVMLMVANVAPEGSNLVVSELTANIVLPPGIDNVVGSQDDPLRMANLATGESARLVPVTQAGADGQLGTGDDITTLGPAQTGNAEFLVEGRREGTHVVEMELAGTLNGLPIGPVPIRGRAAGAVLVRNPKFTLTFTHPDIVNAGEPYTLDVTVTNTTESPANFVNLNLFAQNISGARLDDETTKGIDSIAPGDSASVSFRLISNLTGTITAATLDSDENVAGRFALKTSVGELGVPLSPDSLILPKEASGLPKALRDAALGLLGRAWAVATAPPAALPKDLSRFSKQLVIDRAVETAEAGFRVQLGEPLPRTVHTLLFDFLGSDYTELAARVPANDTTGLLGLLQRDFKGFDLLRRRSVRGDVLTSAMAKILGPSFAAGATAFHRDVAEQATSRPAHVSVLVSGANGGTLDFDASLVDAGGLRLGPTENGKIVSEIPFGDVMTFTNEQGLTTGRLFVIAVPEAGNYSLVLTPLANAPPGATVDISVVVPGADGALRVSSIDDLGAADGFTVSNGATDPLARYAVSRSATGGSTLTPTLSSVNDPLPTVLGVVQMSSADVVGCNPEEDPGKQFNAGRVVAVLFSEDVTPASVQDKLAAGEIVSFRPEANRAVSVALQPGRRIAFVALRKPFGPLVPRTMTIEGAVDRAGQAMAAAVTLPVQMSNLGDAATVAGRVLNADGTPAAGISLRMFYEIQCASGPVVVGIGEDTAGADGSYAFDHVVVAPSVTTKLVAVNEDAGELKVVRFRPARVGQRLNVDVVFIGRGAITGITYAEDGRTPLAGTAIRVTSLTDQSQYGTTTDASGRYTVARVPVGSLLLEAVNVARPATLFVSDVIPFAGAVVTRDLSLLDVDTTGTTISTGVITGRVLRADGVTGIEGVPVIAYYAHDSQANVGCPAPGYGPPPSECAVAVVQSAADGAFSFPAVTSGSLRIYSFDQTGLEEGSVRVTLLPDQTFDLNLLLSGGVGTVRGTVLDSNGAPVTDAVVGGGLSLVNVNPADGTFVLTDVPVGQRTLVAVSESLRARGETTIDIVQAGEQINATIVLEPSASISGLVRDANGVAQSGIKVWVFVDCYDKQQQPSICVEGEATTDATGGYRVDGLKLGTYRVSAFRADLKDGNIAQVALRYNAQVLKTDITFRGSLGTVTGRVLRACGTPPCADTPLPARVAISGERLVVAGGQIATEFRYIQNFEVVDNDFTTGAFEFDGIWAGNFTVKAAGQFSPEPVSAAGTMTAGQTVNLDLRLMPTSRITGTVFEPDGFTPVTNRQVALEFKSNAVVVICTEDSSTGDSDCQTIPQGIQSASAATDAQGRFSFPVVNAGPFTIVATDTAQGRTARVEGTVRAGETVDLTARLLGRSRIVVNVRSNNGITPIAGARVDVAQVDYPKATRTGLTNASGQVVFEGGDALSEGLFVVTATDGGGFVGRVSNTVTTDGATVTANVFLFDATGTVTGQVVREDSTTALVPVPNAEVLVSTASGPIAYTVTDAQGQFEVTLVPTGAITVEAFDPVTAGRGRLSATVLNGQPTT